MEVATEANLTFGVGDTVAQIYVEEGDTVTRGDVLARLDTDALELAVTQAQVALTQQQVAVTRAQVALRTAEHSLDEARDLYTWPEIKVAQADVDDAEAFLQYVLDRGLPEEALLYAQARFTAAEAKLDAMINSYDTEEVAIKKMEVALAEQSLELAQQSLEQIRQSLEQARKNLDKATLTAPFDGLIASVDADEGDIVLATTKIIHLIDPTSMELKVEVDEIDIPGVQPNQPVIIDVDALPALPVEGRVISVSPLSVEEAGVVLYEVKIGFAVPEGSELRAGMSVDADIVITERRDVMLVPSRAIKQDSQGKTVVLVMVGEETQERPVVTGISDGFDTEIVDGLNAGEIVVVERRAR
jgi:RND family efflux transporter MFP subunit